MLLKNGRWYRAAFLVLLTFLAIATGCDNVSDEDGVTGPGEPPSDGGGDEEVVVPDSLALSRTFPPLLANGVDDVEVVATVVDANGRGIGGVGVAFSTDLGTIDPFATTDASGVARTTLTSEASTEDASATVTATASDALDGSAGLPEASVVLSRIPLTASQIRRVSEIIGASSPVDAGGGPADVSTAQGSAVFDQVDVPMIGVTLSVSANPTVIPADGISESEIQALLIETTRQVPIPGETVSFGTSVGTITGEDETDASGTARATLLGLAGGATADVTAFYGNTLTAGTTVTFSLLTLSLESVRAVLPADGRSETQVVATLINEERNPVPGARIDFSTTLGTVTSPVTTDFRGEAVATLRAGNETGDAEVTALFGESLSAAHTVQFVPLPETATLLLSANPSTLPADGASEAVLKATALDDTGNPMPDGTLVHFTAVGEGQITRSDVLTEGGTAETRYVAGTQPGTVDVEASSGSEVAAALVVLTPIGAANIVLAADQTEILADGIASALLSATVTDIFGNPVAPGTVVSFQASRGVIDDVTPTDGSGTATARLRAERFVTGTARVTVSSAGVQDIIDIDFVSEDAANIVAVDVENSSINVKGAGSDETSTITFEVRDQNGIPVDVDHGVTVDFSVLPAGQGDTDATVYPSSATTSERGVVATTINAGFISGAVEAHAMSGGIISQPIRIVIHGDLPDPAHFSVSFERLNIEGLVFDGVRNGVTARVGDAYGNPVPEGTAVWFHTDFGLVQASAFTDDHGEATVWEVTAGPWPQIPGGDGLVPVCAQTVSKAGDLLEVCGDVMWSGPTTIEFLPDSAFTIPNGGFLDITYRVSDANLNPLTAGTTITVSTTAGNLGGDTEIELPDTQDQAFTMFTVTLSDDQPADIARPVTVTVTVVSRNGNLQESRSGTIN